MAKIKPLLWSYNRADAVLGAFYHIVEGYTGKKSLYLCNTNSDEVREGIGGYYATESKAKEAAQKHFKTEILKWVE